MLIPRRRRGQTENESSTTYQDEEANIAAVMNGVEEAEKMGPMPTLAFTELKIGRVLGKGGFSVVSEIQGVQLDEVYDTSDHEMALRKDFSAKVEDEQRHFVIKMLRTDLPEDEHAKGVVDLAIEAEFLKSLSHDNIITMRAHANSDPHESRFFVVLDKLVITLERKMNFWRKEVSDNAGYWMGPCVGYCCSRRHVLHRLWMERLMVSRDIGLAIRYLHSQKICYRDLKPDNVGFDAAGEVKIFDFGLAKRLDPEDKTETELYMLTGNTGSLRYMAPEVALCEPYDQRVDSYSFGILFWQICSLTTPFLGFSTKMHSDRVVRAGFRPRADSTWPLAWVMLMKECWAQDIFQRPDFEHVVNVLDEEVTDLLRDEGVVPTRANEIRAKKRKQQRRATDALRLDVDTRLSTPVDGPGVRKHDIHII